MTDDCGAGAICNCNDEEKYFHLWKVVDPSDTDTRHNHKIVS